MRRGIVVGIVGVWLAVGGTAEAGVGDALKNTWSYLFAPVNCVGALVKDIGASLVQTVYCVISNANRNPVSLQPIIQ